MLRMTGPYHSENLQIAIKDWVEKIGSENTIYEGDELNSYNRNTFPAESFFKTILKPKDVSEISECLKIANRYKIPIHTTSLGRNWGYGSSLGGRKNIVLLSLERLDKILDYNESLAYITVEPGVSFKKLSKFLKDKNSTLQTPVSGTSPNASILGNALERGIGKGPYQNLADSCRIDEVVLASGKIVSTGFKFLSSVQICEPTAGPSANGLFFQSNLGVVTKMTVLLKPSMEIKKQIVFLCYDENIEPCLEALRTPLLKWEHFLTVEIINDYRFLAQMEQFPFETFDGSNSLTRTFVKDKLKNHTSPRWVGRMTIYADHETEGNYKENVLIRELTTISGIKTIPGDWEKSESVTTDLGLHCAYWRKKIPFPAEPDPNRDLCGVLWLSPVLPLTGSFLQEIVQLVETEIFSFGFEPMISLRPISRTVKLIIGIFFDREETEADKKALECYYSLKGKLSQLELFFYRSGILDFDKPKITEEGDFISLLKKILDQDNILSPGKYNIS